jgi:hypothetical protein
VTILDQGPCQNWPPFWDCVTLPTGGAAVTGAAVQAATEVLWQRTHRRFGVCELTLRPCRRTCWPDDVRVPSYMTDISGWGWPFPTMIGGAWFNLGCSACGDTCSCTVLQEAVLPSPVAEVTEVKIDGVVLDPTAYRVDNHKVLVRLDGNTWPLCQDLSLADTEVGTWSVTATYGEQLPTLGQYAVAELATEIVKHCVGGTCNLPTGTVRSVTRQGVSMMYLDDAGLGTGKIGLYWVDLFLATFNPGMNHVASIYDLDAPRRRMIGT